MSSKVIFYMSLEWLPIIPYTHFEIGKNPNHTRTQSKRKKPVKSSWFRCVTTCISLSAMPICYHEVPTITIYIALLYTLK